jgi:hypothetical protein
MNHRDSNGLLRNPQMMVQMSEPATAARAHEEVLAYWASRRDGLRLPARDSIHPAHLKRHLPTISLIDVRNDPRDYSLRLAGTGLYNVYGRDITGRTLGEVYNSSAADYWRAELDKIVQERRPGVGVHNLAWRGAGHLSILWLRLPLAGNGRDVDMILGYDSVIGALGETALTSGIAAA